MCYCSQPWGLRYQQIYEEQLLNSSQEDSGTAGLAVTYCCAQCESWCHLSFPISVCEAASGSWKICNPLLINSLGASTSAHVAAGCRQPCLSACLFPQVRKCWHGWWEATLGSKVLFVVWYLWENVSSKHPKWKKVTFFRVGCLEIWIFFRYLNINTCVYFHDCNSQYAGPVSQMIQIKFQFFSVNSHYMGNKTRLSQLRFVSNMSQSSKWNVLDVAELAFILSIR